MKTLIAIMTAVIISLGGQVAALAAGSGSLAEVAATVGDALATDDTGTLDNNWITYKEAAALFPAKMKSKSDFLQAKTRWKERTDDAWREIRHAKLLVDHVKIEEVRIRKIKNVTPDRYQVVALAVPVFRFEGELRPVRMMAMHFIQVGEHWKYVSQ